MIIVTTEYIPGMKVTEVKGLVRGNAVRARAIGRDITAALRNIIGGEVPEYTRLLTETREIAIQRMIDQRPGARRQRDSGDAARNRRRNRGRRVRDTRLRHSGRGRGRRLAAGPHVPTEPIAVSASSRWIDPSIERRTERR